MKETPGYGEPGDEFRNTKLAEERIEAIMGRLSRQNFPAGLVGYNNATDDARYTPELLEIIGLCREAAGAYGLPIFRREYLAGLGWIFFPREIPGIGNVRYEPDCLIDLGSNTGVRPGIIKHGLRDWERGAVILHDHPGTNIFHEVTPGSSREDVGFILRPELGIFVFVLTTLEGDLIVVRPGDRLITHQIRKRPVHYYDIPPVTDCTDPQQMRRLSAILGSYGYSLEQGRLDDPERKLQWIL